MKKGVLYGIGVGPGAPDLLCLRAVETLRRADVILAAASPANESSRALEICRPHLSPAARIVRLDFPMTRDKSQLKRAWRKAAETTIAILAKGESACFLTLGDPLVYSTFGYLAREIKNIDPEARIEIIPGITSFQAAAAKRGEVLCEGDQWLALIPGTLPEPEIAKILASADTAVILKVYRNREAITEALRTSGLEENLFFATEVERPGEKLLSDIPAKPGYMSLVISKRTES